MNFRGIVLSSLRNFGATARAVLIWVLLHLKCSTLLALPQYYASEALLTIKYEAVKNEILINQDRTRFAQGVTGEVPNRQGATPARLLSKTIKAFLGAREEEWRFVRTLTHVLAGVSLMLSHVSYVNDDQLTLAFANAMTCRSLAGLIYVTIFSTHFPSRDVTTEGLAALWSEDSESKIWSRTTVLFLPIASTICALFLCMLAMLSSNLQSQIDLSQRIPSQFVMGIQCGIVMSVITDVACLFGTWKTMRRWSAARRAEADEEFGLGPRD